MGNQKNKHASQPFIRVNCTLIFFFLLFFCLSAASHFTTWLTSIPSFTTTYSIFIQSEKVSVFNVSSSNNGQLVILSVAIYSYTQSLFKFALEPTRATNEEALLLALQAFP